MDCNETGWVYPAVSLKTNSTERRNHYDKNENNKKNNNS